ncbi:MAG: ester cyclase [Thermoleophilia bacterium]
MDATDVAERYFAAWNAHDSQALEATFAPGGRYRDPGVPEGLDAAGTGAYAEGLWTVFPDLAFAVDDVVEEGGTVWSRWTMTGTDTGGMRGLPPTDRRIAVEGADLIHVAGDAVVSVQGFFDGGAVPRQLGMQVIVQPSTVGPFTFGVCTHAAKAATEPGAVTLTVLERRGQEEYEEIRSRARDTVVDLMGMPGFISWLGVTAGTRHYTITAWESPEAVANLRDSPAHAEAMERFYASGLGAGAQTGVWTPHRLNGMWVRCTDCDEMVPAAAGRCGAGHELPEAPAYW